MNTFPMPTSLQKCSRLVKNNKRVTATKVEEVEARVLFVFRKPGIFPTPKYLGGYRSISVKDEHRLKVSKIIINPQASLN